MFQAANPFSPEELEKLKDVNGVNEKIHTAAVCVYPTRVKDVYEAIKRMGLSDQIQIASGNKFLYQVDNFQKKLKLLPKNFFFTVATGFPSGLYSLVTRLTEIKLAIADGATEIDVVLDRSLVLMGQWDVMYEEVKQMRAACKGAHLKVILGVGELGTYENVSTNKAITVPIYQ